MAKVRLTKTMRDTLIALAETKIACPDEEARVAATYAIAEPQVRAIVEAAYPHADMLICKKYDKAHVDDCIKLRLSAGGIEQFNFNKGTGPLVTHMTYTGKIYDAADATDVIAEWVAATHALNAARKKKINDYRALILYSRTLEGVAEVWPEAETLRAEFGKGSTELVAFSPEIAQRIRADVATRIAT